MISRPQRTLLRIEYLFIVVLLAFVLSTPSAFAITIIVEKGGEDGHGSLRQAVRDANSNGNPGEVDVIYFSPTVTATGVNQGDLHPVNSSGPIVVTESLKIVGKSQKEMVINGYLAWLTSDGLLNSGFPSESTSTVITGSGLLFDVGLRDTDNSAITFTLSKLTVTQVGGVVHARGGANVVLDDVWLKDNAWNTAGGDSYGLVEAGGRPYGGSLTIRNSFISGNKRNGPLITSTSNTLIEGTTIIANSSTNEFGNWLTGDVVNIVNSEFGDFGVQHILSAKKTCLTNAVFKSGKVPKVALIQAGGNELHMNHVTIYAPASKKSDPHFAPAQGTHLWVSGSKVYIANSVISDEQLDHSAPIRPMVLLESDVTLELNTHNHVSDGSLPGAATGEAGLEQSVIHDGAFKPVSGSALTDAGDDAHAVDACSGNALTKDILRKNRKSGLSVDIGAVEVPLNFAIDDIYKTDLNKPLLVPQPGPLANDILDGPPLFPLENGLILATTNPIQTPAHGDVRFNDLYGGFEYVPDPGFAGVDSFSYRMATGTYEDYIISNLAKVTIVVETVPPSRLIVNKVTVPGGVPQLFDFSLTGGLDNINRSFSLTDEDAPYDSGDISAGTYNLTETPVAGWFTHGSCISDSVADKHTDDLSSIDMAIGETVTCTVTSTESGSVVVNLETFPGGDGGGVGFDFSAINLGLASFTLKDGQSKHFDSAALDTAIIITGDEPPPGYILSALACEGAPDFLYQFDQRRVAFLLAAHQTANCTFTYSALGVIWVRKETNPSGDPQVFDFNLFRGFQDEVVQQSFDLKDGEIHHSGFLRYLKRYRIEETVPAGWQQGSAVCNDGSDPAAGFVLDPGENIICTITNNKDDSIVVSLVSAPLPIADLGFTHDIADGTAFTLSPWESKHFEAVDNGRYTITQEDPEPLGFVLDEIICKGNFTDLVIDIIARQVSFSLGDGQMAECQFINLKPGEIIVDLITSPADDPQSFEMRLFGTSRTHGFVMTDATHPYSSGHIGYGDWELSPTTTDFWQLDSIDCDDGSKHGVIDLDPGETVHCTVKLSRIPAPVFTFTKNGVRNGDRVEYTLSWQNTGDADAVGSILSDVLPAGTSFISADGGGVYDVDTNTVSWDLGTIAVGSSQQSAVLVLGADTDAVISNEAFISFNQDRKVVAKTTVYGEGIFKDSFETP